MRFSPRHLILVAAYGTVSLAACSGGTGAPVAPIHPDGSTPTATPVASAAPSAVPSATPIATAAPTATPVRTASPAPTASPTPVPTTAPTTAACGFNITEISLPAGSNPDYITGGPDGNLWFTENGTNKIGRMTTTGTLTEFPIPTANSGPFDITPGPDGNLWFTEFKSGKIGRITTAGTITEFTSANFFRPWNITTGPDGNLWYTDNSSGAIGRMTTSGVASPEFAVQGSGAGDDREPYGIVAGPDGNMWITDFLGAIDKMTTSGTATRFSIGSSEPDVIAVGPDGAMWFTLSFQYAIGHVTTGGTVAFDPTPSGGPQSYSNGIAAGPDDAMWFALNASAIGRITTSGSVEECPTPTQVPGGTTLPFGMTKGSDGEMWFTENEVSKIGHIPTVAVPVSIRRSAAR